MYIEDLLEELSTVTFHVSNNAQKIVVQPIDLKTIDSLVTQMWTTPFTEKQQQLALKMVKKYVEPLSLKLGTIGVSQLISNPKFRYPARAPVMQASSRRIEIHATSKYDKKLRIYFPYNEGLLESIKEYKRNTLFAERGNVAWTDQKHWEFDFTELNIKFLSGWLSNGFTAPDEFVNLINQINQVEEDLEKYVPMVAFEDGKFLYKNTSELIPQPVSDNLIEVLIHAKAHGISCWDDAIDLALKSKDISAINKKFIKHNRNSSIGIDAYQLYELTDIVRYSQNIVFVIPGGHEYKFLKHAVKFLLSEGYTTEQISVLFRLDNVSPGATECNEFIKNSQLNNKLTDEVRFIFVSGKLPKPLLESGKNIDLVLHYGTTSAHFSLANYIKYHHAVFTVNISDNKEITFV